MPIHVTCKLLYTDVSWNHYFPCCATRTGRGGSATSGRIGTMSMESVDESVFVQRMQLGAAGLRVGVKDSIDIAGYPMRAGSAALADAAPAARHAAVVQALLERGCRIVGKTNMHELAYGVTGINLWTGTP